MIRIEKLSKQFKTNRVLKELDLNLQQSGITALLGPNGSGKTTLVKCILGLVLPDKGEIYFHDKLVKKQFDYRNKISYLPQIARFPENLTVRELLDLMKNVRKGAHKEESLVNLFGLKKEMNKKMSTLSGGTRQKLNLTLAFMYNSPLIMLDEPSTGLDPLALINLKDYLLQQKIQGKQILLITHILSLVQELADNVIFILDGKIYYQGGMQQLIDQQGVSDLEHAIAKMLKNDASNI